MPQPQLGTITFKPTYHKVDYFRIFVLRCPFILSHKKELTPPEARRPPADPSGGRDKRCGGHPAADFFPAESCQPVGLLRTLI